jgi:hypothetical protein
MGYGFVIFYKDTIMRTHSSGLKRTQADGGPLNFDVFAKVQLASLSKTVTAIAVLQILASKNMNTYAKINNCIPSAWIKGPNVDKITFRDLLRHEAGIRPTAGGCDGHTYDEIKCRIQTGVNIDSMGAGHQSYNNQNYALFRVIIPNLLGFPNMPLGDDAITAGYYIKYVQDNVLSKSQITKSQCYPDTSSYMFYYHWPYTGVKGTKLGDNTLYAGATGWYVSVTEYASLINKLFNTEELLKKNGRDTLFNNNLGCFD